MRLPWSRKLEPPVDPRRPHAFRVRHDKGVGALAPIGGSMGRQVADIAAASSVARSIGCGVPGCGRPEDDLIHAPAD